MLQSLDVAAEIAGPGTTAATFRWSTLDYANVVRIRAGLAGRYSPATANKCLSALRGVLRQAMLLDQMAPSEFAKCVSISAVRGSARSAGRCIPATDVNAIMKACADPTAFGLRDAGMVALLYGCGLRRSEIVGLSLEDYDRGRRTLNVVGKGRKQRTLYVNSTAFNALERWLGARGREPGPLFVRVTQSGRVTSKPLSSQAVYRLTARVARSAGVGRPSPHDFRRTFVSVLLDRGADLSVVQQLVGHASPATTVRYDRRGERALRRAVGLLQFPVGAS